MNLVIFKLFLFKFDFMIREKEKKNYALPISLDTTKNNL